MRRQYGAARLGHTKAIEYLIKMHQSAALNRKGRPSEKDRVRGWTANCTFSSDFCCCLADISWSAPGIVTIIGDRHATERTRLIRLLAATAGINPALVKLRQADERPPKKGNKVWATAGMSNESARFCGCNLTQRPRTPAIPQRSQSCENCQQLLRISRMQLSKHTGKYLQACAIRNWNMRCSEGSASPGGRSQRPNLSKGLSQYLPAATNRSRSPAYRQSVGAGRGGPGGSCRLHWNRPRPTQFDRGGRDRERQRARINQSTAVDIARRFGRTPPRTQQQGIPRVILRRSACYGLDPRR
jgi:hypothetical protein